MAARSAAPSRSSPSECSTGRRSKSICGRRFAMRRARRRASRWSRSRRTSSTRADLQSDQRRGAKVYAPGELRSGADPRSIEQAIEILLAAERPLIAAGDGIFWSGAAAELREFVELTRIPVYARRTGQGAVAEDHPLAIRGPWKKPFTGRADAVLAIGFRFWSGEKFGEAPTWSESARYIQADATPTRIGLHVPAEVAMVGDAKLVLRQLADAAARERLEATQPVGLAPRKSPTCATNFDRAIVEQEHKHHDDTPIHPARVARELCEVIDPRRNDRDRQLHDERLDVAMVPRSLPRPNSRRRARSHPSATASAWPSVLSLRGRENRSCL